MTPAQINAINEAKKNGGRALTTAQVRAVGDDAAMEAATALLDQFESQIGDVFADYTAELKNTGNKYSLLTQEDIDEHLIYEDFLMVCPMFGEVLEMEADEMHESLAFWLDEARGQSLEENRTDLANTKAELDAAMGLGDPNDEFLSLSAMITVLEYIIEEQETGVRLPTPSTEVE